MVTKAIGKFRFLKNRNCNFLPPAKEGNKKTVSTTGSK